MQYTMLSVKKKTENKEGKLIKEACLLLLLISFGIRFHDSRK